MTQAQEQELSFSQVNMNNRQRLFVRYIIAVFIDLTVLNIFTEYFPNYLHLETFSLSLLAALLLQTLLQLTLKVEHKVAIYFFEGKSGLKINILRGISAWSIIFISKLIMLKALSIAFGDAVHFGGPVHGVIAFIVAIAAMIIAEQILLKVYNSLA